MGSIKLKRLLEDFPFQILQGSLDVEIHALAFREHSLTEGALVCCIPGLTSHEETLLFRAVEKGAAALIIEGKTRMAAENLKLPDSVTLIQVEDSRHAAACVSAAWFDHPARQLQTIGITGTKGKTTTAYMIRSILENAGIKTGLIGTIEVITGNRKYDSAGFTTPPAYTLQKYMREMVDEGCQAVVMEVSSVALMLYRTQGFIFDYGVFTNIAPDHIGPGNHRNFDHYLDCKAMLFQQCRVGIVNCDDAHIKKVTAAHTCSLETYGFSENADLRVENARPVGRQDYFGISCRIKGLMDFPLEIGMPGLFSIYNALAAVAVCRHFHVSSRNIVEALKTIKVKGRAELVPVSDHFTVMIDYAHNVLSLENLLMNLRAYHPIRLVCLFGCGGNPYKEQRFAMGEAAGKLADFTIITSDNPRDDDPGSLMDDIRKSIEKTDGKFIEIQDRKEAIAYAIHHAMPGDLIVLAGKGHEDYQVIRGKKYPMDERVLIREILGEKI